MTVQPRPDPTGAAEDPTVVAPLDFEPPEATPAEEELQARWQIVADLVVIAAFAVAYEQSRDLFETARWFPGALTVGGLAMTLIKLVLDVRRWRNLRFWLAAPDSDGLPEHLRERREASEERIVLTPGEKRELLAWIGYVALLLVLIRTVGLLAATAVWLPLTLITRGKQRWYVAAVSTVALISVLMLLEAQIGIRWPDALFDVWKSFR